MTSGVIPVSAQWALEGKEPGGAGYSILACSTGDLNQANFADALSRFQVGELDTLPEVSLSYARLEVQPAQTYVALAIHWNAGEGQRYARGVEPRDGQGRLTAYTSYFCLPYEHLKTAAVGYLAMYDALCPLTLSVADGPPLNVKIAVPAPRIPAADDLAMRIAPLLLTNRPVCVLGADGTTMLERLEFIDTVMGLLPYGFRSRMTAATWTRATNLQHRFKLFFSSAARADSDVVVPWDGEPEQVPVPDQVAGEYLDWLQEHVGSLARLTELTGELRFGSDTDILRAREFVFGTRPRPSSRTRRLGRGQGGVWSDPERGARAEEADDIERILRDCVEDVRLVNPTRLRSDIHMLNALAKLGITDARRRRYRDEIARLGLFRYDMKATGGFAADLFGALLKVAYGTPLSYPTYCQVEQYMVLPANKAPRQELLAAIVSAGMTDTLVSAIVYWRRRRTDGKRLTRWLESGEPDLVEMITFLASPSASEPHARIITNVALNYLFMAPRHFDVQQVRNTLRQHGFLAPALQIRHRGDYQYQIEVLRDFLAVAYPPAEIPDQDLSPAAIAEILGGTGSPPTPALLSAVLLRLRGPQSMQLARETFLTSTLTLPQLDQETMTALLDRLPPVARLPQADAATVTAPRQLPAGSAPAGGEETRWIG